MLTGALFGAIGATIGIIIVIIMKKQKTTKLIKSVIDPGIEYSGFFYCASANRYQKSVKIYDSTGLLYLIGNTVYYKTGSATNPAAFNLSECKLQLEPDWRRLKWFSITTPEGEKYYFDSYKMGAFSNDSNETIKAFDLFKSKTSAPAVGRVGPPPLNR
jgi:hypothetical protein